MKSIFAMSRLAGKAIIGLDAYPELTLSGTVVEVGIVPDSRVRRVFPVRLS